VGRFREFIAAYDSWIAGWANPAPGAGEHKLGAGTGWQSDWDTALPPKASVFQDLNHLKCDPSYHTWTDTAGDTESLPINCVSWYEAFSFCIWEGARLATEAEWEYAAAHGSEYRTYAWGSTPDPTIAYAIFGALFDGNANTITLADIAPVGSAALGHGFWGQQDLTGNMWEWTFDAFGSYVVPCDNCANTTPGVNRMFRGGSWGTALGNDLTTTRRIDNPPDTRRMDVGIRCARTK